MSVLISAMSRREDLAGGGGRERLNSERSPRPSVRALRRVRTAHGTGPRARRLQDIESDTGYDTRRRVPDGARARVPQTTVYDIYAALHHELGGDRGGGSARLGLG